MQVNITLEPHWRLILRFAAEADGVSVPDLLPPGRAAVPTQPTARPGSRRGGYSDEKVQRSRRRIPDKRHSSHVTGLDKGIEAQAPAPNGQGART